MKNFIEPYAKEKNTLQLALFYFGKGRPEKNLTKWSDENGKYKLECVCKYGVPGSFEQDVYTATMRLWIKQNRPKDGIKLNYSDIARELRLEPPKHYVGQIKNALERLAQARYEFKQCFIQVKEGEPIKIDTHFSLYDSASLFTFKVGEGKSKRTGQSQLIFPQEIQKNLEAKYYQLLDMVWYRKLPEGLPRRLYEYLEKRRYHNVNGKFSIAEVSLCRWLPVTDKNPTQRRKTLKHTSQPLIDCGYLISYEFDKTNRVCTFTYAKKWPEHSCELLDISIETSQVPSLDTIGQVEAPPNVPTEIPDETQKIYLDAMNWLDTISYFHKLRKQEIAALPFIEVAKLFPGIKAEYEKQKQSGKTPNAGWIFKAFMEKWSFSPGGEQKTDRQISEEKRKKQAEEAFAMLPPERQDEITQQFQEAYAEYPDEVKENKWVWVLFLEKAM